MKNKNWVSRKVSNPGWLIFKSFKPLLISKGEIIMKMKKPLNPIQTALLKKHIKKFEEKDGVLTEAFTIDGDAGMILYEFVSPNKTVRGVAFI